MEAGSKAGYVRPMCTCTHAHSYKHMYVCTLMRMHFHTYIPTHVHSHAHTTANPALLSQTDTSTLYQTQIVKVTSDYVRFDTEQTFRVTTLVPELRINLCVESSGIMSDAKTLAKVPAAMADMYLMLVHVHAST